MDYHPVMLNNASLNSLRIDRDTKIEVGKSYFC